MDENLIKAVLQAGEEILKVYHSADFEVETKTDNSPLTRADLGSHSSLMKYLETTDYPVISEEGEIPEYAVRKNYKRYWLIDPLDGTKEFIKRNGEFTVNVALIEDNKPVLGVVYAPVKRHLYYGDSQKAIKRCYSTDLMGYHERVIKVQIPGEKLVVVASRSHNNAETEYFIEAAAKDFKEVEIVSKGSSLKLVEVAEGKAHLYPRFGPTMEWDTAAAHAVVLAAGGTIAQPNGEPLKYNKENLLNPVFVVKVWGIG